MNLCIIIPAYNERMRIEQTIRAYHEFFALQSTVNASLLIVLNGCTDTTPLIVADMIEELKKNLAFIRVAQKGKGNALIVGFEYALSHGFDLIGFVDADMATRPFYFFDLIRHLDTYDGIIDSRYMPQSQIYPPRPLIKRWGSRFIYEKLIKAVLGMDYYDFQCGAKIFKRNLIKAIIDDLTIKEWALDIEILYLAHKKNFKIREYPTIWYDQKGSKMTIKAGFWMLTNILNIWLTHNRTKKDSALQ